MDITTLFKDLNISKFSVIWAFLADGWAGLAKLLCEAFTKILSKANPAKLKEYSELAAKIVSFIRTGIDLFLKDEKVKAAAEATAKAIEQLANHIADGIYNEQELNEGIANITACIDAWKKVAK